MTSVTLTNRYVADTVAVIFRLEQRKMGPVGDAIFDAAEAGSITIYIPAMAFAEILYLGEKKRINIALRDAKSYIDRFPTFQEYPLDLASIQSAAQINDIMELHDRLIGGTARALDLELITNDLKIQASSFVQTVW